ncbi:MAG: Ger(x)C family spore germination protein [Peptococcaceae bacterium]|jgi:spore germination protein KC|nr:Ger(x)C family spore germination protein [Peptococcaceae bacterium]
MIKHNQYLKFFIALLSAALLLSGCWDQRELDTLAIVMAIAIDKGKEAPLRVSVQVLRPTKKTQEGPGEGHGSAIIFGAEGKTLVECISKSGQKISRGLFFPHNNVIIYSQSIAQEGVRKYYDYFLRNKENRGLVYIVVARNRAEEIFQEEPSYGEILGWDLRMFMFNQKNTRYQPTNVHEFLDRLLSESKGSLIPIVDKDPDNPEGIDIVGMAVFQDDQMVGELKMSEYYGWLLAAGKMQQSLQDAPNPDGAGDVGLDIMRKDSKIIPEIVDGLIKVTIDINVDSRVISDEAQLDLSVPQIVEALERSQAQVIREAVLTAWQKEVEFKVDFFQIADELHRRHPREWQQIKGKWNELLPRIQLDVQVHNRIIGSGMLLKPPVRK